jgi:hypothetical protein
MKNILNYIVLVILVAATAGCGKDGFKLFDADVKLSKSFDVNVPAEAPLIPLTLGNTFDATTDPEIKNVVDRIDRYKVNSVSYSISEYSGEPTILEEGIITVKSDDGSTLGRVTLTNVDLQALNNAGEQVLPFEPSEIDNVEAALKDDNKLELVITATIDNKPVAFKLSTFIDLTVEYRVFD